MALVSASESLRVLVIRLSAMGDVAMVAPVLRTLRTHYPKIQITMLTPKFLHPFFREVEGIEFVAPDLKGRHKGIRGMLRLNRDIGHFDMVADLHDVLRSKGLCTMMRLSGARVERIDKGRAEKRLLTAPKDKHKVPLKTTIDRYREVFVRLGFDLPSIPLPERIVYPLHEKGKALAGSQNGERWIGISPFAQHRGKTYPTDRMREVILQLSALDHTRLFLFGGGAAEKEYAEQVASLRENITSAIGCIPLAEEMELISHLDLMVSMDSSALHMSSLVGVPVVSVWGATHPFAGFYGFGQDPQRAVQIDLPCRPCSVYGNKPCLWGDYRCMTQIPPERIVEKVCLTLGVERPTT